MTLAWWGGGGSFLSRQALERKGSLQYNLGLEVEVFSVICRAWDCQENSINLFLGAVRESQSQSEELWRRQNSVPNIPPGTTSAWAVTRISTSGHGETTAPMIHCYRFICFCFLNRETPGATKSLCLKRLVFHLTSRTGRCRTAKCNKPENTKLL